MAIEKFLKEKGIVKTKNQANLVMYIIIAICLIYIFTNIFGGKKSPASDFSPEEMEIMMQEEFNNQQYIEEETQPLTEEELYY